MAVYVDRPVHRYGRMRMCHMLADTLDELHVMAARVGLKPEWFQAHSTPHYDVCKKNRELALRLGAIQADRKQVVALIRKYRHAI